MPLLEGAKKTTRIQRVRPPGSVDHDVSLLRAGHAKYIIFVRPGPVIRAFPLDSNGIADRSAAFFLHAPRREIAAREKARRHLLSDVAAEVAGYSRTATEVLPVGPA